MIQTILVFEQFNEKVYLYDKVLKLDLRSSKDLVYLYSLSRAFYSVV